MQLSIGQGQAFRLFDGFVVHRGLLCAPIPAASYIKAVTIVLLRRQAVFGLTPLAAVSNAQDIKPVLLEIMHRT